MKHENICYVVLAICSLHNYLRRNCTAYSRIEQPSNQQTRRGDKFNCPLVGLENALPITDSYEATESRERYKRYFNSTGAVEWQDAMIRAGKAYSTG